MKADTSNSTQQKHPFFSLVIPTLNEEKYLPKLLACLTQQTYRNFEVIHVDGNSEDKTVKKAASFKNKLNLRTVSTDTRNAGHQRNLGGDSARGQWIVFMDADTLFKPHFLQGIKYQLDKHPETGIFSAWLDIKTYPPKHKPTIVVMNFWLELSSRFNPAAYGALLGVHSKIFSKIKFNPDLKYGEDVDLIERVVQLGQRYQCWKDPKYYYSFRRFDRDGFVKPGAAYIEANVKKIINGEWEGGKNNKYPMLGGGYYNEPKINLFEKMANFFDHATQSQKQKALRVWNRIVNSLDDISLKDSLKKQ